eukprot:scaffold57237_cov51-Attheya_sp.AAC.1
MPHRFRNSITTRGMSGSEGGMLAMVNLVSAAVELDDLVESVELLVAALGGGQTVGWQFVLFLALSLSQLLLFSQGFHFLWIWMGSFDMDYSSSLNAGHLSRNGWLLVVDIMHLNWQQSTQIVTQRIEFIPLPTVHLVFSLEFATNICSARQEISRCRRQAHHLATTSPIISDLDAYVMIYNKGLFPRIVHQHMKKALVREAR